MTSQKRLEVYAEQCNLRRTQFSVSFWNVGAKITPRQRRRYLKKDRHNYSKVPPF